MRPAQHQGAQLDAAPCRFAWHPAARRPLGPLPSPLSNMLSCRPCSAHGRRSLRSRHGSHSSWRLSAASLTPPRPRPLLAREAAPLPVRDTPATDMQGHVCLALSSTCAPICLAGATRAGCSLHNLLAARSHAPRSTQVRARAALGWAGGAPRRAGSLPTAGA
jgi:hypothetical protein